MIKYNTIKKLIFNFQPETAHNMAEFGLRILPHCNFLNTYMKNENFVHNTRLTQTIFGAKFHNVVGLGAGFDKNATMVKAMPALGFGFTEIGTVTPKPQDGNPKPRLFRYVEQESIQNAMGFNNQGSDAVLDRLQKVYPYSIPIGVNIGKNKLTTPEKTKEDYTNLTKAFKEVADYFVINISSPNTPNLRDLQNEEFIKELFEEMMKLTNIPILLKIAPDMSKETAINLCQCAVESGASGIIATNTTIDYDLLKSKGAYPKDFGGVSGAVMSDKSYMIFRDIAKELYGKTTLISVGGISDAKDAYRRIKAGASLVQSLSGFIFKGPSMCNDINNGILELMDSDGFNHISEAIGADLR
jgi:dihydroorotate dehydrogenase